MSILEDNLNEFEDFNVTSVKMGNCILSIMVEIQSCVCIIFTVELDSTFFIMRDKEQNNTGSEIVLVAILAGGMVFLALLATATVATILCCKKTRGSNESFPLLERLVSSGLSCEVIIFPVTSHLTVAVDGRSSAIDPVNCR